MESRGGGCAPGNCKLLKCVFVKHTRDVSPLYEVWGSPKVGGGGGEGFFMVSKVCYERLPDRTEIFNDNSASLIVMLTTH